MSAAAGRPRTVTFESLPADVAAYCVRLGRSVTVHRGSVLARQGENAVRCYYVRTGYARVVSISPDGHQILVGFSGPQDLVGQMAAAETGDRYLASTIACQSMNLIAWGRSEALALTERFPEVHARLDALLLQNGRLLIKRLHTVSEGRVPQRVANVLLELAARHGKRDLRGVAIEAPVTREDLAGLTGTTLYTVSRVLAGWQLQGVLESRRGRVRLTDPSRLKMLARSLH